MVTQFRPEQADLAKYWDFGSGTMRVPAGGAFPGGPNDGDIFYRTDEDKLYVYDGAAWEEMPAHNVLSTIHADTLADNVVDGDVVIGNVTPKWSRLAISVPAANIINVLGVGNGELRPSWKSALADVSGGVEAILKSTAAGDLAVHDLTATGQLGAGAGIAEGIVLGADAQWYRSATNMLRTPDSVTIDVGLNLGTATGATSGDGFFSGEVHIVVANAGAQLVLERVDTSVAAGADIGRLDFVGGEDVVGRVAQVRAEADQDWTDTASGTRIVLSVIAHDTLVLTEAMRLDDELMATFPGGLNLGTATGAPVAGVRFGDSANVAHGMTGRVPTDVFGQIVKGSGTPGGLAVTGYKDADGTAGGALVLQAHLGEAADTSKDTGAIGVIRVMAYVKSDASSGAVGADGNLMVIQNTTTTRFIFDAEGSAHADVEWVAFQDHDDCQLLAQLEDAMLDWRDPVKTEFDSFLGENALALERLGIVHFDRNLPGHAMLNTTRLAMLHTGAIRQLGSTFTAYRVAAIAEREAIREQIRILENQMALLDRTP